MFLKLLFQSPVKWPLLMYLGLTVAAPYLIWKLLGSFNRLVGFWLFGWLIGWLKDLLVDGFVGLID